MRGKISRTIRVCFSHATILALILAPLCAQPDFERLRRNMVEKQIELRGIEDNSTLAAIQAVERHRFVPESLVSDAYLDRPLPIGHGQTISQPYIVAYMTEVVKPKPGHKVLEIGAGSGYQAAVLAEIVEEVYTIEIIEALASQAAERLKKLGYDNIHVRNADGYYGWPEEAPFDAIVVTAAADHIPPPLIDQLKDGGRMIIPVGSPLRVQQLMLVEKSDGETTTRNLMPVRFVPFTRDD